MSHWKETFEHNKKPCRLYHAKYLRDISFTMFIIINQRTDHEFPDKHSSIPGESHILALGPQAEDGLQRRDGGNSAARAELAFIPGAAGGGEQEGEGAIVG